MNMASSFLLVLGEREALAWVLRERRMAFTGLRRREVERLSVGDELFLLTTRGCFHNPTRDRTRLIGRATVASEVTPLLPAIELGSRTFTRGCSLDIQLLAPYLSGVELSLLVPMLDSFPSGDTWGIWLRRSLVSLCSRDAATVRAAVDEACGAFDTEVTAYLQSIKPAV
ncbi:hypothetical protein GCM10023317_90380 [Actinopolymorpha pittospori]